MCLFSRFFFTNYVFIFAKQKYVKFVIQYYGRLKELFDFNKFAKFILSDYFRDKILVLANITKCIILGRNVM